MGSALETVRTALITGASSGIGRAFARPLAAMGKDLILVARREDRLQALAAELSEKYPIQAHILQADLAQPDGPQRLFADTEGRGLTVDLLVNAAGFARVGEFSELPWEAQAAMIQLNVQALVELTRRYLPGMRQRHGGGVINIASTAAFQPVPYMAVYAATKAFVLSFSEAVAQEVAADGVTVLALCPGATATEFWSIAGHWQDRLATMQLPDRVAALSLRAFDRRRSSIVPGLQDRVLAFAASRLSPRPLAARLAARILFGRRS